jgi:hypothetical protein
MSKEEVIDLLLSEDDALSTEDQIRRRDALLDADILDEDIRSALIELRKRVMGRE